MTTVEKPPSMGVKSKLLSPAVEPDVDMDRPVVAEEPEEDLYTTLKTLQRQLEFYEIQVGSSCVWGRCLVSWVVECRLLVWDGIPR